MQLREFSVNPVFQLNFQTAPKGSEYRDCLFKEFLFVIRRMSANTPTMAMGLKSPLVAIKTLRHNAGKYRSS